MGVIDGDGVAVSFIQSIYHEFGSGVVLKDSGVQWQNRGCSFSLDPAARNPLTPGRKPFPTLNPALARLSDGRVMVYGNMGGDGQPQSQAAVFNRITRFGMNPQAAIAAPRWLLGRTWGDSSETLKIESRFSADALDTLRGLGHLVEVVGPYDEVMGHAGAIVLHPDRRVRRRQRPAQRRRGAGLVEHLVLHCAGRLHDGARILMKPIVHTTRRLQTARGQRGQARGTSSSSACCRLRSIRQQDNVRCVDFDLLAPSGAPCSSSECCRWGVTAFAGWTNQP